MLRNILLFLIPSLVILGTNSALAVRNPNCHKLLTFIENHLHPQQAKRRIKELRRGQISILNIDGLRVKRHLMKEMSEEQAEEYVADVIAFYSPKNDVAPEYIAIDFDYPLPTQAAQ